MAETAKRYVSPSSYYLARVNESEVSDMLVQVVLESSAFDASQKVAFIGEHYLTCPREPYQGFIRESGCKVN